MQIYTVETFLYNVDLLLQSHLIMKKNIHPKSSPLRVQCRCKETVFDTVSTLQQEVFYPEKCVKCHPYYTGVYNKNINEKSHSARAKLFNHFDINNLATEKTSKV